VKYFFLFILVLASVSLGCGPKIVYCVPPKGEPTVVYKNPNRHFKETKKDLEISTKGAIKASNALGNQLEIAGIDVSVKNKVVKLRDDLNNSSLRITDLLFRAAEAYNSRPCDKVVRDKYFSLLDAVSKQIVQISELENSIKQITTSSSFGNAEVKKVTNTLDIYYEKSIIGNN